ncbi:hypothetical protein [Sediminibacillus massiliensis]|uniref:hypothetical protein n=1 Tax=Sediminibacillus massiliensis TaxID=1926277 RepID=UPI0009882F11|nr:hypothetical protein [Sediminibacillus massiliensis]
MAELQEVVNMMMETSKRIDKATRTIYKLADKKAETERVYRSLLAQEIIKLKEQGMPATLIADVARGNMALMKFERDAARDVFNSARDSLRALEVQASVLQTISRYNSDV